MKLIADCGSTKIQWCAVEDGKVVKEFFTPGMNAIMLTEEEMAERMGNELKPEVEGMTFESIYFYGAGCIANAPATLGLKDVLASIFPNAKEVLVATDMLGAAHALCGHDKGIVCILGTGSNSAQYDGEKMTKNVPPLGYILGDEGGGTNIGRTFVSDALKGVMNKEIVDMFYAECNTSYPEIIENVYRKPNANRYLASFVPFVAAHRDIPEVRKCIDTAFNNFIERNLLQYPGVESTEINFVGSVAFVFEKELTEALERHSLKLGKIMRSPITGMVNYHTLA